MDYRKIFTTAAKKFTAHAAKLNEPTRETFAAREEKFAPGLRGGLDYLEQLTAGRIKFGLPHKCWAEKTQDKITIDTLNEIAIPVSGMPESQDCEMTHIVINAEDITLIANNNINMPYEWFDNKDMEKRVVRTLDCLYTIAMAVGAISANAQKIKPSP